MKSTAAFVSVAVIASFACLAPARDPSFRSLNLDVSGSGTFTVGQSRAQSVDRLRLDLGADGRFTLRLTGRDRADITVKGIWHGGDGKEVGLAVREAVDDQGASGTGRIMLDEDLKGVESLVVNGTAKGDRYVVDFHTPRRDNHHGDGNRDRDRRGSARGEGTIDDRNGTDTFSSVDFSFRRDGTFEIVMRGRHDDRIKGKWSKGRRDEIRLDVQEAFRDRRADGRGSATLRGDILDRFDVTITKGKHDRTRVRFSGFAR